MKAKVIKIGNSRGLRLPRTIIDEVGLEDEVTLEASRGALVVRPVKANRSQWREAFSKMAQAGDDTLIDVGAPGSWDEEEWEWK